MSDDFTKKRTTQGKINDFEKKKARTLKVKWAAKKQIKKQHDSNKTDRSRNVWIYFSMKGTFFRKFQLFVQHRSTLFRSG